MKKRILYFLMALILAFTNLVMIETTSLVAATTVDLKSIEKATVNGNVVTIQYNDGLVGKITFLENDIFRLHIDPGGNFDEYAAPVNANHTGRIQKQSDSSNDYAKPVPTVKEDGEQIVIQSSKTTISLNKTNATMRVEKDGKEIIAENSAIQTVSGITKQNLKVNEGENFYGGGTQNGRFAHKGEIINIVNENNWVDGGVASPSPFYWSTNGYGILRNTFKRGQYDFGKSESGNVIAQHNESKFDAYYFLGDQPVDILQNYFKVTGNPILLPEYAYYLGHLNAYNRDGWASTQIGSGGKVWKLEDGQQYYEYGRNKDYKLPIDASGKIPLDSPYIPESLNGDSPLSDRPKEDLYKFSARAVIDGYEDKDMPLGFFLPNDGYGAGYGQNGYYQNFPLGTNNDKQARLDAINGNIDNLKRFTEYANSKGVATGLWAQSALTPDESEKDSMGYHGFQTLRDFDKEVNVAGIQTLKTDAAWVGSGYSFALNATRIGFEKISSTNTRPNIITLDGWAGTQRHAAIWSGDQTGGNWEYIRFHIPTYIGQSLSGNPNVASDIDGIFGGSALITTRDIQWKAFTPSMLDMDGWGTIPKKPYGYADDNEDINRMYLKLKAELMPYLYSTGQEATNGLPMVRAMFLEFPEDAKTYGKDVQYQYMYGDSFLVAPVYKDTQANANGDDIRNGIYLPGNDEVWIDYFSGEKYQGGRTINNFKAPLWKLPLFVKSGSIIPMYEENNNPFEKTEINTKGLDKTKRVVEFYPTDAKKSEYTLIEDDGMYIDGVDESGKEKAKVSYGGSVSTTFTAEVTGDKAVIKADKSTGDYSGYDANRNTTFVVNLTSEPTGVEAFNGTQKIDLLKATTEVEFDTLKSQGEGVYYYNEAPNLNKYAQGTGDFSKKEITTTPKLYVAYPKANVQANEQKLVISGYENDDMLGKDEENLALETPQFMEMIEADTTPKSITLRWNEIADATTYELKSDGEMHGGFPKGQLSFIHDNLQYDSEHKYQIRSRNSEGYSKWSEELVVRTNLDPWRNVPVGEVTSNIQQYGPNYAIGYAFDQKLDTSCFFTKQGDDSQILNKDIIIKYDDIYTLDTFTYHWNMIAYASELDISTSLDGVHWELTVKGSEHPFNFTGMPPADNPGITISLNQARAKYVKLTPRKISSTSGTSGFSASEFIIKKVDESKAYPLGDFTLDGQVNGDDVQQISQYKGAVRGDGKFESQIEPNNSDINKNGVFDVYDYSFVMTQVDGGTQKTGVPSGAINANLNGKQIVTANETFDIVLSGTNLKNVNALGAILKYDNSKYDFIGVEGATAVTNMTNMSAMSTPEGSSESILTVSFNNQGNKDLISGNQELVKVKMKAKVEAPVLYPETFMLVGPKNNLLTVDVIRADQVADKTALKQAIEKAELFIGEHDKLSYTVESWDALEASLIEAKTIYEDDSTMQVQADNAVLNLDTALNSIKLVRYVPDQGISGITFKNDQMEEDDGIKLWQQANWKSLMFDGVKTGSLLEFKWFYTGQDNLGAEVKLPTDFNFTFDTPKAIDKINVYNRVSGNGSITSIEAIGITENDETVSLGSYDETKAVFEFSYNPDTKTEKEVKFKKVVITPKTSIGSAAGSTTGTAENRMLSIYEIEFEGKISLDKSSFEQLITEIDAIDLASYTEASVANLSSVRTEVQQIVNNTNKQAEIEQAIVTLRAAKDALVLKEVELNTTQLTELLTEIQAKDLSNYTKESVDALMAVVEEAETLLQNPSSQDAIDGMVARLETAITGLVENEPGEKELDKSKLEALLSSAEQINTDKYTKESVAAFLDCIDQVKVTLQSATTQEEIDAAYDKLLSAISALKVKEGLSTTGQTGAPSVSTGAIDSRGIYLLLLMVSAVVIYKKKGRKNV